MLYLYTLSFLRTERETFKKRVNKFKPIQLQMLLFKTIVVFKDIHESTQGLMGHTTGAVCCGLRLVCPQRIFEYLNIPAYKLNSENLGH